jgi:hypothetical protein
LRRGKSVLKFLRLQLHLALDHEAAQHMAHSLVSFLVEVGTALGWYAVLFPSPPARGLAYSNASTHSRTATPQCSVMRDLFATPPLKNNPSTRQLFLLWSILPVSFFVRSSSC